MAPSQTAPSGLSAVFPADARRRPRKSAAAVRHPGRRIRCRRGPSPGTKDLSCPLPNPNARSSVCLILFTILNHITYRDWGEPRGITCPAAAPRKRKKIIPALFLPCLSPLISLRSPGRVLPPLGFSPRISFPSPAGEGPSPGGRGKYSRRGQAMQVLRLW